MIIFAYFERQKRKKLYFDRYVNFLGHFFLSQNSEALIVGNFIADCVKGKSYLGFPENISEGILMHRRIDAFTDQHPQVRKSRRRLFNHYRHYSSVIVDMFYDHFLALYWKEYSGIDLKTFSMDIYRILENHRHLFPEKSNYIFSYMKSDNWLLRYGVSIKICV